MDAETSYDAEEDILFTKSGQKTESTIDVGDYIIDIDAEGNACDIEILNASQNLGVTPKSLKSISKYSLESSHRQDTIYMRLVLTCKDEKVVVAIPVPFRKELLEEMNQTLAKSELTEEDAVKLGRKLNKSLAKRHTKEQEIDGNWHPVDLLPLKEEFIKSLEAAKKEKSIRVESVSEIFD